jgi:hypothetical protein
LNKKAPNQYNLQEEPLTRIRHEKKNELEKNRNKKKLRKELGNFHMNRKEINSNQN